MAQEKCEQKDRFDGKKVNIFIPTFVAGTDQDAWIDAIATLLGGNKKTALVVDANLCSASPSMNRKWLP